MADALMRLVLAMLWLALLVTGANAEVLNDHDNGPLTGYFGVPDSTEGAILAPRGESRWDISVMTSSHSISDGRLGESIVLDGETTQLNMVWRRGVAERLEIGVEVPWLWHESGGLDSLVQTWHDVFGFPDGFRSTRQNDTLEFVYEDPDGTQIDFRQNANGLGDVRLLAGWRLSAGNDYAIALRAGIKLPTGDSEDLLGSGGADVSLGIAGDHDRVFGVEGLSAFYRAHAILLGEPDLLADRHRDFASLASFGFGYWLGDQVELRVQGAIRTAMYDSTIEVLGEPSGTVTFGGNFRLGKDYVLTLSVSEDVKVLSAPDVSFRLALRYRPE
jgi:hypothetical protein